MTALVWGATGSKVYETGASKGVVYPMDGIDGGYGKGVAWIGLTTVTESPSGAESNKQYADDAVYANLISAEEFGATIEAFASPEEFDRCDGTVEVTPGVTIGQQERLGFGFSYRTILGNDAKGNDFGYKIHLVYGCKAAPTEKAHATVNDSPEAINPSWEVSTTPVAVTGFKPTATVTIDSTKTDPKKLAAFEKILYGDTETEPRLPLPDEVKTLLAKA